MQHALHLAVLSFVVCLSAVCLGISVRALYYSLEPYPTLPSDSSDRFALATSVLTLLTVIPLYVVWELVASQRLTTSHVESS
jgi:hypothetical protein